MVEIVEKRIDGIVYKAQYKGDLMERLEEVETAVEVAQILFDEVLVSPKITIDDFPDLISFYKVQNFLYDVAQGYTQKKLSKTKLKRRVKDNWALWRLVVSDRGFDWQTVFGKSHMTPQDVEEANIALEMQYEAERKAMKSK